MIKRLDDKYSETNINLSEMLYVLNKDYKGQDSVKISNYGNSLEPVVIAESILDYSGAMYKTTSTEVITGWSSISSSTKCWIYFNGVGFYYSETAPEYNGVLCGWYDTSINRALFSLYKNELGEWEDKYTVDPEVIDIKFDERNQDKRFPSLRNITTSVPYVHYVAGSYIDVDPATGNYVINDPTLDQFHIVDPDTGGVLSSFSSPGSSPGAMCIHKATGNLISYDTSAKVVYKHDGISSTILASYPYIYQKYITDMTVDEASGNLVAIDSSNNYFRTYSGISQTLLSEVAGFDFFTKCTYGDGNLILGGVYNALTGYSRFGMVICNGVDIDSALYREYSQFQANYLRAFGYSNGNILSIDYINGKILTFGKAVEYAPGGIYDI